MSVDLKNVGSTDAWILIYRYAENWSDAGRLMEEWRDANSPTKEAVQDLIAALKQLKHVAEGHALGQMSTGSVLRIVDAALAKWEGK